MSFTVLNISPFLLMRAIFRVISPIITTNISSYLPFSSFSSTSSTSSSHPPSSTSFPSSSSSSFPIHPRLLVELYRWLRKQVSTTM